MNESEMLYHVIAGAIAEAQANGLKDVVTAAEEAAKAFKAGLAAFNEASRPSSELTLKVRIEASPDK